MTCMTMVNGMTALPQWGLNRCCSGFLSHMGLLSEVLSVNILVPLPRVLLALQDGLQKHDTLQLLLLLAHATFRAKFYLSM